MWFKPVWPFLVLLEVIVGCQNTLGMCRCTRLYTRNTLVMYRVVRHQTTETNICFAVIQCYSSLYRTTHSEYIRHEGQGLDSPFQPEGNLNKIFGHPFLTLFKRSSPRQNPSPFNGYSQCGWHPLSETEASNSKMLSQQLQVVPILNENNMIKRCS